PHGAVASRIAADAPEDRLCRAKLELLPGGAHMFGPLSSGAGRTVRTYVPQDERFDAHAARARGTPPLPLVPHARGRRRRRLGGRLDRACGARRAPSPSSAARAEAAEAGAAPARR